MGKDTYNRNYNSINSLEEFLENRHLVETESMNPDESAKKLEESVVEILYESGNHKGNGVLVTEDGYLLTANHIEDKNMNDKALEGKYIRNDEGEIYSIDRICQKNEYKDIMLIKANITKKSQPRKYKVWNVGSLENNSEFSFLTQISKWGGKNKNKNGQLLIPLTNKILPDFFLTDISTRSGDSGGIVFSKKGTLIGLIVGEVWMNIQTKQEEEDERQTLYNQKKVNICSNIFWGMELISKEINYLKQLK